MADHILIVEDEPKIAALLADYLRAHGYETQSIHRGDEVLEHFQTEPPALVLPDLKLPGLDGIEVCKQLRTASEVPIIMVTAPVEEIDRLLGLELGAEDYICKPFSPREAVARVKAVLRRAVDTHVKNLRKKLNAAAPEAEFIESVYGLGYRFSP